MLDRAKQAADLAPRSNRPNTTDAAGLARALQERAKQLEKVTKELAEEAAARRDLERRLQAAHDELETTVEQRTAQLRTANADLVLSEERFRSIVELSADAIIIANASGQISQVNSAACSMFGYSAEELTGRLIEDLLPSDLRAAHVEHRTGFDADPRPRSMGRGLPLRGLRSDGSEFPAEASLTPFQTPDGLMVAESVTDVTQRRQLLQAVEQTVADLRRSNAELEQFAYVASHDLQEPLRMVSNYTQLLARRYRGRLDPDADDFIGFAVEGASRMQQLINDLLEFSRVGSRGRDLVPVAMQSVIEKTLFNLGASIQESGVAIEMGPMPQVEGDENQLIELLQNLLVNAIKFRAQDAPRIQLTAEFKEGFWTFAVKDNGIGIDPAYKDRIFVIFQRLHTRAEYAGTGIGLAVCKRIVERHGGHIWVESTLGEGATFCFTLRAVNAGADEAWAYIDGLAI